MSNEYTIKNMHGEPMFEAKYRAEVRRVVMFLIDRDGMDVANLNRILWDQCDKAGNMDDDDKRFTDFEIEYIVRELGKGDVGSISVVS